MDLLSTVRILLRRWYIVAPVGLASLMLAAYVFSSLDPSYEVTGTSLLRYPSGLDQETASENPYLGYGTLFVAGKVATDIVSSPASREALAEEGVEGTFELLVDNATAAPLVFTRVEAPSEAAAIETATRVLQQVQDVLQARQEENGAPPSSWISSEVVSPPTKATQLNGSRLRAAGAVTAAGGLLALALALGYEALARRRAGVPLHTRANTGSAEVPCSLCGSYMPVDQLVRHLEAEHELRKSSAEQPPQTTRPVPATAQVADPEDLPVDAPFSAHSPAWPGTQALLGTSHRPAPRAGTRARRRPGTRT